MDATKVPAASRKRFRRLSAAAVVALVVFGLTDVRRRARIDPANPTVHKTDLTIFTGAGAAFLADDQPYRFANPRGWKYGYPPLFAVSVSPLAALPAQQQAVIWYALSCLAGWLAWREAVRIGRGAGIDLRLSPDNATSGRVVGWLAVGTALLPALNCLQRGQVGLVYLWLLLWGYRLLVEAVTIRAAFAAGVLLALPGVIKVTPALPAIAAVGVLMVSRWRPATGGPASGRMALAPAAGLACGGVLFLLMAPAAVLGWRANLRHLETWTASIGSMAVEVDPTGALETPYTLRNQSLSNAAYRFGNLVDHWLLGGADDRAIDAVPFDPNHALAMDAPWVGPALLAARIGLLLLLAAVAWVAAGSGDVTSRHAVFGLACAASLIVSPLSRGHYFVMLLPAALWAPVAAARDGTRLRAWLLATPAILVAAHYVLLDLAGRAGVLGLGTTAWYIVAAAATLRGALRDAPVAAAAPASPAATLRRAA